MKEFPARYSIASDNFSGVHPEVLEAITKANQGHAVAYGDDPWTEYARELFKKHFGPSAEMFIMFNGTAANVSALKHVLSSWEGVVCPENAHIWTDECGALGAVSGSTLLPVASKMGKVTPDALKAYFHYRGGVHHIQPRMITITQSTELGTLYTLDELRAIGAFARKEGLLFHMDGARLSNAAAALQAPLKALTADVGVDILSFGGTKNGLMGVEAIVFLKPDLAKNFPFVRKQEMQLASKMRFLSAQFIALLEGDLWLRNAKHANAMAKQLEGRLKKDFPKLRILYPVEANALFVELPHAIIEKLQKKHFFWIWDEAASVVRWMTAWDTKPEYLEEFLSDLKSLLV